MIDCGDNRGKLLSYCQCISCIRVFQYNLFSGIFKNFQISTDDAIHPLYQSCQYPAHSNDDAERHENLFIQPNTTIFPNIKPCVLRFLSAPPSQLWKKNREPGSDAPRQNPPSRTIFSFLRPNCAKSRQNPSSRTIFLFYYIHTDKFYTFEVQTPGYFWGFFTPAPSSVASERQFSTAGDIYKETRSRLTVDNADRLIFIMKNKNHM